jgi:hypothetical protein
MPLANRVTPLGELIATPERGLVYGNRGCLHDANGRIRRSFNGRRWIACRLQFRGRRRAPLLAPGRYTELFFLDEVTAFAAGHRPCAECRREDYNRVREALGFRDRAAADAIDARLHAERLVNGSARRLHELPFDELPDGAFALLHARPWLVLGNELVAWSAGGYRERLTRPRGEVACAITPPALLVVLRAGWAPAVPLLHPSALLETR